MCLQESRKLSTFHRWRRRSNRRCRRRSHRRRGFRLGLIERRQKPREFIRIGPTGGHRSRWCRRSRGGRSRRQNRRFGLRCRRLTRNPRRNLPGSHSHEIVWIGRFIRRYFGLQPNYPLPQRRVPCKHIGDHVRRAVVIAGLHKAGLELRREGGDIRQQPLICGVVSAGQQVYGNRPSRGDLAAGQRVVGLADRVGNPAGQLKSLIEAHASPKYAMDLAAPAESFLEA